MGLLLSCAERMRGDRPLDEKLTAIRQAGFDGVDVRWSTPAAAGLPVGAVYSQLRDPGLPSRPAVERAAVAASVETALLLAARNELAGRTADLPTAEEG